MKKIIAVLFAFCFVFFTSAQDAEVINKIKDEGTKTRK
jgi:hypothetical protein